VDRKPAISIRHDFGKAGEVGCVERVDVRNAVHVHGRKNLQIEDVAAGFWSATKQANEFLNGVCWHGQNAQKTEKRGNRGKRGGRGARICNAPGIGDDAFPVGCAVL
jgi:hypothetical protein